MSSLGRGPLHRMGYLWLVLAFAFVLACEAERAEKWSTLQQGEDVRIRKVSDPADDDFSKMLEELGLDESVDVTPLPVLTAEQLKVLETEYKESAKKIRLRSELMANWDLLSAWVGTQIIEALTFEDLNQLTNDQGQLDEVKVKPEVEKMNEELIAQPEDVSIMAKLFALTYWKDLYFKLGDRESADFRARALILNEATDAEAAANMLQEGMKLMKEWQIDAANTALQQAYLKFQNLNIQSAADVNNVNEQWGELLRTAEDEKFANIQILRRIPNYACAWEGIPPCKRMKRERCIGSRSGHQPNREDAEYRVLAVYGGCASSSRPDICQCRPGPAGSNPPPSWAPSIFFFPAKRLEGTPSTLTCDGSPIIPSIRISRYECKFNAEWAAAMVVQEAERVIPEPRGVERVININLKKLKS